MVFYREDGVEYRRKDYTLRDGQFRRCGEEEEMTGPNYASLGDRALGQLVDGLIVLGLFFLFGIFLAGRFGGMTAHGFELTGLPALILLGTLFVIMLVYFVVAEVLFGLTLGKVVADLEPGDLRLMGAREEGGRWAVDRGRP